MCLLIQGVMVYSLGPLGIKLLKRICKMFSISPPCSPFLALEIHIGPTACGTFRKHTTKPFEQPDAPDCIISKGALPTQLTHSCANNQLSVSRFCSLRGSDGLN